PSDPSGRSPAPSLTLDRGKLPGLRAEIHALDRKMQKADESKKHEEELFKLVENYQNDITALEGQLAATKDEAERKQTEKDLAYARKQQSQRQKELKAATRLRERSH